MTASASDKAFKQWYATSEIKKALDDLPDDISSLLKRMTFNKVIRETWAAAWEARGRE